MKKKFTFLMAAIMLLTILFVPMGMWGQSTSTLTFTAACGGSGTANDGAVWTVTSDAPESQYDGTKGIHYGTGKVAVSYLNLTTDDIEGTITQIVVNASGASGTSAKLDITVGGSAFGTQKDLTGSAANYTVNGSASGEIVVSIHQTSTTKALYCKSIAVTYSTKTATTTEIIVPGDFNNNKYNGDNAGTLTATVTPTGGSTALDNPTITWSSSNTDIATIDASTGAVTLVAVGSTIITASYAGNTTYAASSATYNITVINAKPTTTAIDGVGITNTDVYAGTSAGTLTATVTPTGESALDNPTITWSSSNIDVATIGTSTGVITLVAAGSTTITASYAGDETYAASSATYILDVTNNNPERWIRVDLTQISSTDVFVIVGDNGSTYALPNTGGGNPSLVNITVSGEEISSEVGNTVKWNLGGNATDGYTFYPNGSTTTWLYCSGTGKGVRVGGTTTGNLFKLSDNGYIYTTESGAYRYIGIYNDSDWRCYTSCTGTSNIADQTFAFYKLVSAASGEIVTYKTITGAGSGSGKYYLVASPVTDNITPSNYNGFLREDGEIDYYDLYYFDQSETAEWRNYKQGVFDIVSGKGYLYANKSNTNLIFKGIAYTGEGVVDLEYSNDNPAMSGWNLIGNPYNETAYLSDKRPFYRMNDDGDEIIARGDSEKAIAPMEGIFVQATAANQKVTFTTTEPVKASNSSITFNVIGNNDNVIDRAIVNFNGNTLEKLMINENNTKIYIPQNKTRYAVACGEAKGSMPVNFKAAETGKYTISVNAKGLDMDYLHLVDRLAGEDINLLLEDSYSFIASKQDPESRFILSFTANGYNNDADATFAYQNGSEIIVNGEGELQIFDVTGRKVMTTKINGVQTINGLNSGVYIFRVIGDTLRTQKIVVR